MTFTRIMIILSGFLFLIGCNANQDIEVVPNENEKIVLEASAQKNEEREFIVREEVKDNNVYVECIIPNFKFSNKDNKDDGDGHINLYLNGNKVDEIYTAAFIIKGLPKGEHQIDIELVHNNGQSYEKKETIHVSIKE